jgi:hypothetical protein
MTLNVLEYLAGNILIWMDIHIGNVLTGSCFLSQQRDGSEKLNFSDINPMHLMVARDTATMLMDHASMVYSQWFQGVLNEVADSLSRDHHLSDYDLLKLLHSCVPEQIPSNFRICPLPQNVVSKITTWLLNLPPSTQSPTAPQRSKLATGDIGIHISQPLNSMTTPSSPPSQDGNSTELLPDSLPLSKPMMSSPTRVHQRLLHQFLAQSEPPSMRWHRPTGKMTDQAQFTMPMANSHSCSSES